MFSYRLYTKEKIYINNNIFKWSLFILMIFSVKNTTAQKTYDSTYIEKYEAITLKLAYVNAAEVFSVNTDYDDYVLSPNPSEIFRVYVNYKIVAFYINYIPHFLQDNNDIAEKGRSRGGGLGLSYNLKSWYADINYNKTKGYYLLNTSDYVPNWKHGDAYLQVPDLRVTSIDGSFSYNTNPQTSLLAPSSQTERQLKSAGAFIPKLSYRYYIIDNPAAQKSNNLQLLIGAGYQQVFVIKKVVYILGAFTPSFGYVFTKLRTPYPTGDVITHTQSPAYQWDTKIGIGYNDRHVFGGVYLNVTSTTHTQGLTTAVNGDTKIFMQLFLGTRIPSPKFLKRTYEKITNEADDLLHIH